MNRIRRREQGSSRNTGAWMVTFSDLTTLLLTFFVLLLSMSSMDDLRLKSAFYSFTASSGIMRFKKYGEISRPKERLIEGLYDKLKEALIVREEDDDLQIEVASEVLENPFEDTSGSLVFQDAKDGFKLIFGQELLFGTGSAEVKNRTKPILAQVARFILASGFQVYIDGHTDDVPIHNEIYPSNDDLSLARAYNVMAYLVKEEGVPAGLIALSGYGDDRPLSAEKNPLAFAKNRRVEVIFKNQKYF